MSLSSDGVLESSGMRVAALYDIHANLPALEAVLKDVRHAAVDQLVIGGDVLPGPMPRETLARLLALDLPVRFIQGNGDREVLACFKGMGSTTLPKQAQEVLRWCAEQISQAEATVLATWPQTVTMEISGMGEVLFCHATPRSDTQNFTRLTPADRLLPIFEEVQVATVICGHTHMQFRRQIGRVQVVNAGSVGMPFGAPGAYWLLLGPDVELRQTAYDLPKAAESVRATHYPQADEFAARNILQPPSEAGMLTLFDRPTVG